MGKKLVYVVLLIGMIGAAALAIQHYRGEVPGQPDDGDGGLHESLAGMSLDEKVGQMIIAGLSGTSVSDNVLQLIHDDKVGGFILYSSNMTSPEQTVQLLNRIKDENRDNRLPLLLGVDQEGGRVSRLPGGLTPIPANRQIGAADDPDVSYAIGELLGRMTGAFGFNLNFAPVLDVNSNPDNPVIGDRSFGDEAELVSRLGIQTMIGMQAKGIIPVIKHFPGHGDTSVDSHLALPSVGKTAGQLRELELIPFREAIEQGADMVMTAHIVLPELDPDGPATLSERILTDMLRKELGFDGVVVTDDMTMKAITDHYEIGAAAVEAVKAGSDLIMVAHGYSSVRDVIHALKTAVEIGELTERRLDESVARIIRLKQKYELGNDRVESVDVEELNASIGEVLERLSGRS